MVIYPKNYRKISMLIYKSMSYICIFNCIDIIIYVNTRYHTFCLSQLNKLLHYYIASPWTESKLQKQHYRLRFFYAYISDSFLKAIKNVN